MSTHAEPLSNISDKSKARRSVRQRKVAIAKPLLASEKHSMAMVFYACSFLMRAANACRARAVGDIDQAILTIALWLHALEHRYEDIGVRNRRDSIDDFKRFDHGSGMTATSLASLTGLPRETVRRKLKKLIGVVSINDHTRFRISRTPAGLPKSSKTFRALHKESIDFVNACALAGAIRINTRLPSIKSG